MIARFLLFLLMAGKAAAFQQSRIQSRSPNFRFRDFARQAKPPSSVEAITLSQPQCNITLQFPPFPELMRLSQNEFVSSEKVVLDLDGKSHAFQVNLYPKGGGHKSSTSVMNQKSGFGMSYKVLPLFGDKQPERVGVYLQYLPQSEDDCVDASFAFRLKGKQREGPVFDVEWRAGIQFADTKHSKLAEGRANDFGAHLMNTWLLEEFCGHQEGSDKDGKPVELELEIMLHGQHQISDVVSSATDSLFNVNFDDIRGSSSKHNQELVRAGQIVVPVLRKLSQRPKMFRQGAYPGVEYRILRVIDPDNGKDQFYSSPGSVYEMRPIYPLVAQLERMWPIQIREDEIPKLFTPLQYNVLSALGSLATAFGGLFTAFLVSQAISLFFIPSRSMDPTLEVGDVLLVEKVTPRLIGSRKPGDIVLFQPPSALQDIVARSGGRLKDRDLFVKRIAAGPGDTYSVEKSGKVQINGKTPRERRDLCQAEPLRLIEQYIEPVEERIIQKDEVAVFGDCASVSVDSRVWGPLPQRNIVGRPLLRIWPLSRFGTISSLPE